MGLFSRYWWVSIPISALINTAILYISLPLVNSIVIGCSTAIVINIVLERFGDN